jgi:hypothetical protein
MAGGVAPAIHRPQLHKPMCPQIPPSLWHKPLWRKPLWIKPPPVNRQRLRAATFTVSPDSSKLRRLQLRKPRIALRMDCLPN